MILKRMWNSGFEPRLGWSSISREGCEIMDAIDSATLRRGTNIELLRLILRFIDSLPEIQRF